MKRGELNKSGKATLVKLTTQQYQKLRNEAETLTKEHKVKTTIPDLLRYAYFKDNKKLPIESKPDLKEIIYQLKKIGNNLNQISRKYNMFEDIQSTEVTKKVEESILEISLMQNIIREL